MAADNGWKSETGRRTYYVTVLVIFLAVSAVVTGKIITNRRKAEARNSENRAIIEEYSKEAEELSREVETVRDELSTVDNRYRTLLSQLKETDREFYNLLSIYDRDLESLKLLAGLTSVSGSGIVIKLDDSGLVATSLVHDTYLTEILNVLKEAGYLGIQSLLISKTL